MSNIHEVVDLSSYNTVSSHLQIASSCAGAILRLGYRGYGSSGTLVTDSQFWNNYNGLSKYRSSSFKIGIYWVTQAISLMEALEEARYIISKIDPGSIDFPIYIDSEKGNPQGTGRADKLDKDLRTDIILQIATELRARGLVYMHQIVGLQII